MSPDLLTQLEPPATYFPLHRGRFEVTPGLVPISTSFGNGAMDNRLFQIDRTFPSSLASKRAARAENLGKYVLFEERFDAVAPVVNQLLLERLTVEYPRFFEAILLPDGNQLLQCHLTSERLLFDSEMHLFAVEAEKPVVPAYTNAFDALLSQVPEDMAIVHVPEDGTPDTNIALHITAPSHWEPAEKIGKSFLQTHEPVSHFERIAKASNTLMRTLVTRGPFVRFNWGIEFTDRWNLHPEPPPYADASEWNRRTLRETDECPLYLRLERQTLWGIKSVQTLLFAIRIYVLPITTMTRLQQDAVRQTLLTMPPESRVYKSLPPETFDDVIRWLENRSTS